MATEALRSLAAGSFTDEQRAIADLAYTIGSKYSNRRFDDASAGADQWAELTDCGFTALSLPDQYGGVGGLFELILAAERLAAGGYPAAKLVTATAIPGPMLSAHGTDEQKERWLPAIASGTTRFCFAFTEPTAGSNARKLQTRATKIPGGWRIRGEKTFISALESSEGMILVARDGERDGLTVFALPLPHPGISWTPVKVEARALERQWSVFFDDAEVSDDMVLGEPGGGGAVLFEGLNPERLIVAGEAIGVGRWCLARAVEYARHREVFDMPIGAHQAVQHPLAEAWVQLEAAWSLTDRTARLFDEGVTDSGVAATAAKLAASDAGLFAADAALQVFGGSGYTEDVGTLQRFVYMRLLKSIPVARELVLNHLATRALGLPRSY